MGFQFPDAAMSGKPMKASYINDLRSKINIARGQVGWTPINWGPDLTTNDVIRASHMNDIRDRIRELWVEKDLIGSPTEFPSYTTGQPTSLKALSAPDTNDNRIWLNMAQNYPTLQGVSTLIHDPAVSASRIDTRWLNDIHQMQTNPDKRIKVVRCTLNRGASQSPSPSTVNAFVADFNRYISSGYQPFALINKQTYDNGQPINAGLETLDIVWSDESVHQVQLTNRYIEGFAKFMGKLIVQLYQGTSGSKLRDFIIWNEPNDGAASAVGTKRLSEAVFSALLRRTWLRVKDGISADEDEDNAYTGLSSLMLDSPPQLRIHWAGIQMVRASKDVPHIGPLDYIDNVYTQFKSQNTAINGGASVEEDYGSPVPWHGTNVHMHEPVSGAFCKTVFDRLNAARAGGSDSGFVTVGEWGIKLSENPVQDGELVPTSNAIRGVLPSFMFYYSHDTAPDAAGDRWGLRKYYIRNNSGAEFAPCPTAEVDDPVGWATSPCNQVNGQTVLYDRFQLALNQ